MFLCAFKLHFIAIFLRFVHDATPFRFDEKNTAIDYFGKLLQKNSYNYYGTERVFSGVDGREMSADIFMGIVHYQRLRHLVSDKWQCRSTGPIDNVTHQPVKGKFKSTMNIDIFWFIP